MGNLTADDIQGLINKMCEHRDPQLSYSSIKKVHDAINSCLKDGFSKGDIALNPCAAVKMPASSKCKPQKERRVLPDDDRKNFVAECRRTYSNGSRVYAYGDAYILMLHPGLRLGEMLGLAWSNVLLEQQKIHICQQCSRQEDTKDGVNKVMIVPYTKTSSSVRDVPLDTTAIQCLENLQDEANTYVVETPEHSLVAPENFRKRLYSIFEHCGIPKMCVHDLRHTFATNAIGKGADY